MRFFFPAIMHFICIANHRHLWFILMYSQVGEGKNETVCFEEFGIAGVIKASPASYPAPSCCMQSTGPGSAVSGKY